MEQLVAPNQECPSCIGLREHLEKLFDAKICAIRVRLDAMDKALEIKVEQIQERFHQINNLRREVTEDRIHYATKDVTNIVGILYAIAILILGVLMWFK